jgi:gas vesicle protein
MGDETMDNNSHENGNDVNNPSGFLAGLMVGGLAGAGAMLLLAPRSGKKTRAKIQQKGVELREQTGESVVGAVAQARTKARQTATSLRKQAEELQQRGQDAPDQREVTSHESQTLGR